MRLALLLSFAALGHSAAGQISLPEAVRLFDDGNQLYAAGSYSSAIESYEHALSHGYSSPSLFYNLGNAHYRLDQIGYAIRAFERARLMAPDDPQILHNLAIARERTIDRFSRIPEPFWQKWWSSFAGSLGSWGLFVIGSAAYIAAIGLSVHRVITGRPTAWLRRALSVSVIFSTLFLGSAFAASFEEEWNRSVVVIASRVPLLEEPSAEASVEVTVHEGLTADVLDVHDEWLLLRIPNGVRGWAPTGAVAEI